MARVAPTLRLAVAVAVAIVAAVAAAAPAAACSCVPRPPLADAVAAATYAVRAKVTSAVFIPDPITQQSERAEWSAEAVTAFKGCLPSTFSITSGANGALCGVSLTVGTEYLFVLGPADGQGKFSVGLCSTFKVWGSLTAADRRVLANANDQVCPSRRVYG